MRLGPPPAFFGRAMLQRPCSTQFGLRWEENRYGLSQARMLDILESRSVASNNFNDAAAQIHLHLILIRLVSREW